MFSKKQKRTALRFRQWQRKSHSVFHSIGRHVTIGRLKSIVSDTLLAKQKGLDNSFSPASFSTAEKIPEDDPPLYDEPKIATVSFIVVQQKEKTYAYSVLFTYLLQIAGYRVFTVPGYFIVVYSRSRNQKSNNRKNEEMLLCIYWPDAIIFNLNHGAGSNTRSDYGKLFAHRKKNF